MKACFEGPGDLDKGVQRPKSVSGLETLGRAGLSRSIFLARPPFQPGKTQGLLTACENNVIQRMFNTLKSVQPSDAAIDRKLLFSRPHR